jgi:Spy/CpxP family protein refolding chaperone
MKKSALFASAVLGLATVSLAFRSMPLYADSQMSATDALSQRPRIHRRFGHEAPLISIALKYKSELKLSADQVTNLEQIRTNYQNQAKPIQEQLGGIENEIATLLQESPANLITVKAKIEDAEKLRSELRYLRIEALENGKSLLTAEQRDQLKNLLTAGHRAFRKPQQGQPS